MDRYAAVICRPLGLVGVENKATWAKIYVVIENKACLEILLWVDFARFAGIVFGSSDFLTFENLFELRSAVPRFK